MDEEPASRPRVPARGVRRLDMDRLPGDGSEQLVVGSGALAVRIVRHRRPFRTPPADALAGGIDQGNQIAVTAAVLACDDLPHQLNEFVYVALAVPDQISPESQSAAAGAAALFH